MPDLNFKSYQNSMEKTLIISTLYKIAAIVHKNQVQEYIIVHDDYQVSDIYLGIISKIFQSINAAFVDLQTNKKSGFIHVNDSGPLKRKANIANITQTLVINQRVLVQIVKESTLHKGPKLTANIALPGKYIVLMPFNHAICIARSIVNSKQRCALKSLAILFKPFKMGLLFRQCSVGISEEILLTELKILRKQWNFIEKSVVSGISPHLIYRNNSIIKKTLYDLYNPSIKNIVIDSRQNLLLLKDYFKRNIHFEANLELLKTTEYHRVMSNIFGGITKSFENCTQLSFGGYISIETSEALTTIDVNSGSFNNITTPRETVLTINCLAATEISYQLLKRNITGIIIIDFIDMHQQQDQKHLLQHFSNVLQKDYTRPQIVQLSELGLVEIVRQRTSKPLTESLNKYLLHRNFSSPWKKSDSQNLSFNNNLLPVINKQNKSAIFTRYNHNNSIFFKRVFSSLYYIIYKYQHIYNRSITTKYSRPFNIAVTYSTQCEINTTTIFSYTNLINNISDFFI